MGKLIADSGSTKTAWLFIPEKGDPKSFETKGINPFFRTTDEIFQELNEKLKHEIPESVDEIFFYGAGIINQKRGDVVKNALTQLFPDALIETHSDVLGAARALFGSKAGIACIMGTGSNACLYDGERIVTGIPPLGFILGDECSGAVLGRKLLGDYFKNVMPNDLETVFQERYAVTEAEVLRRVYRSDRPNRFLASFAPFLSENISKPYCRDLVLKSLNEFFERNVLKIPEVRQFPIGFVGSVAFAFSRFVEDAVENYGFGRPVILQEPIAGLKAYHSS